MIIANSPDPSYFKWFTALNKKEKQFKLTYVFLLTENTSMAKYYREEGIDVRWFYFNYAKSKYLQFIRLTFQLFRLFRQIKPDVVQTNLFDDSLTGLLAARLAGVKKRIATKQDTGFHILYFPKYIKLDRFINWNATDIIPSSGETKELIMKYENPPVNKIKIIHHGMSEAGITNATTEQVTAFKHKYNLKDKIVVGSVSRYVELKGYRYIISAAKIALQKYPNLHFLFIGTGQQKDELASLIRMNNLENNITLTGRIDFTEIATAYKSMDIFIHASEVEAFGFVFVEAMFNKVPIISTHVGAVRDALSHKENVYITKFKNPEDIAEGINFMMQSDRKLIAEKAYAICREEFAIEIMWEKYKYLFNN